MLRKSRIGRIAPNPRPLLVEALEERTLLTGVVLASIDVPTGRLQVVGSASADNAFTIAPSPLAGMLRVSGDAGTATAINGVGFSDFRLSSITSINMTLGTGTDKVTFQGVFGIPGNVNISYNNPADTFSFTNFTANSINVLFAGSAAFFPPGAGGTGTGIGTGTGGSTGGTTGGGTGTSGTHTTGSGNNTGLLFDPVTLTGVRTGSLVIVTGMGSDSVTLSASTSGATTIITPGAGNDSISISGCTLGNLTATAGDGNNVISVTGTPMARATITSGRGSNTVTLNNDTFSSNAATPALSVSVGVGGQNSHTIALSNLVFSTNAPNVLFNGSMAVSVGDALVPVATTTPPILASKLTVSHVSGANDVTVTAGQNWNLIDVDNVSARSVNVGTTANPLGANTTNLTLNTLTVTGPINVNAGANTQNVQLAGITTFVSAIDLALGRLADVTLNFGNGTGSVMLNSFSVGRNLSIANGNGSTMFMITNGSVGQNLSLTAGNGTSTVVLDTVSVLNQLFVQLGLGFNVFAAHNVQCGFGTVDGGPGGSNVYFNQGGNFGFVLLDFSGFVM
jgi:hypothetical protein